MAPHSGPRPTYPKAKRDQEPLTDHHRGVKACALPLSAPISILTSVLREHAPAPMSLGRSTPRPQPSPPTLGRTPSALSTRPRHPHAIAEPSRNHPRHSKNGSGLR